MFRCLYPCNLMYFVHLAVLHRLVHAGSCIVVGPTVTHTRRPRAHRRRPTNPSAPLRLTPPLAEPASHLFRHSFRSTSTPLSLPHTHSLIQPAAHVLRGKRVCQTRQAHPAQHRPANKAIFNLPPTKPQHLENPQFDLPGRPGIYLPYLSDVLLRGSSRPRRHHSA